MQCLFISVEWGIDLYNFQRSLMNRFIGFFFFCIGLYKIIRGRCAINEVPLMNRTRDTWKWGIASVKVCPTVVIRRLKRQSA